MSILHPTTSLSPSRGSASGNSQRHSGDGKHGAECYPQCNHNSFARQLAAQRRCAGSWFPNGRLRRSYRSLPR